MTSERIPGGGDPAGASIDTSWLRESSDPSGGDRVRGRGGRRRARRRTLSPSIGSKSFMSGVDFDDPAPTYWPIVSDRQLDLADIESIRKQSRVTYNKWMVTDN